MKIRQILLFLFLCSAVFLSCENDTAAIANEIQETRSITLESFTAEQVPIFSGTLSKITDNAISFRDSRKKTGGISIDYNRILAVTDSVGNISYSARMYIPDTPYNVFYNVIAKVTAEGEQRPPFVLRYEIDEAYYETYKTTSRDKAPFKGIKKVYSLDHFLEGGSKSQRTNDSLSVYCGKIIHNGDSPNGSPTNGGGGNPNGAGTGGSYSYINNGHIWYIFPANTGGGDDATTPIVEVGEGNFGEFGTDGVLKSAAVVAKDPNCPEELLLVPINEEDARIYPSCESFEYSNLGTTGIQVAAVDGIWDVVTKTDRCPGIGLAASYQTYYFQLPSWTGPGVGATKSAEALARAFFDLGAWFKKQGCSKITTGVLAIKMDEFIKDEFKKIGGQATRSAPLGWSGKSVLYQESWFGPDACN